MAALSMLFGPEGAFCTSAAAGTTACQANRLTPCLGGGIVALTGVALGMALVIAAFFLVSFGVGLRLLPAAALLAACAASRPA